MVDMVAAVAVVDRANESRTEGEKKAAAAWD